MCSLVDASLSFSLSLYSSPARPILSVTATPLCKSSPATPTPLVALLELSTHVERARHASMSRISPPVELCFVLLFESMSGGIYVLIPLLYIVHAQTRVRHFHSTRKGTHFFATLWENLFPCLKASAKKALCLKLHLFVEIYFFKCVLHLFLGEPINLVSWWRH